MADQDSINELTALVTSFLQQSLKEKPDGYTIHEFEQIFPERADEPRDWYKRYNAKDPLQALEAIKGDTVRLGYDQRRRAMCVRLDIRSDKVDHHLLDLIINQKAPTKKRRGGSFGSRPSSRASISFSLNRQYSASQFHRSNYCSRINHDQYRDENFIKRGSPPAPPQLKTSQYRTGSIDPRLKSSSGSSSLSSLVPPQVRSHTSSQRSTSKQSPKPSQQATAQVASSQNLQRLPAPPKAPIVKTSTLKPKETTKEEDPVLKQKKSYLRQRILSLLTRKFSEIKLLHLGALYQLEFDENIDPNSYGYPTITALMQDPEISAYIQINYKSPFITVSAMNKIHGNGKENNVTGGNAEQPVDTDHNNAVVAGHLTDKSNTISSARAKVDAIDPFNVRTMLQNLEPIGAVKEPALKALQIEDTVKYRTLRLIFKSPNSTLKLEDWPQKFEQESRLKPRLGDYGCKTLLEFFKLLARELPIRIILNKEDEWIAVADINLMSEWLREKMAQGYYRATISIEARYELIAFPNDTYTYNSAKSLLSEGVVYQPAYILSINRVLNKNRWNTMWIQLRTTDRIEKHLCVEDAMTAYEDYNKENSLRLPTNFIKPGLPCVVYDSAQQRWCRALVLKAPEVIDRNYDVTVLLVDYAIIKNYATSQLNCLMKTHLKPPVGPIYSRLFGIRNEEKLEVQRQCKKILQEYTSPPVTLACRFLKAIPSEEPTYMPVDCLEITLVDTRQGRDCNLADDVNLPNEFTDANESSKQIEPMDE